MDKILVYDVPTLAVHVAIVALATVGIVEWCKNFVKPKETKGYAVLGLFILLINASMQIPLVPNAITWSWNLVTLGLACMQFGHGVLIKLPEIMLERFLEKK